MSRSKIRGAAALTVAFALATLSAGSALAEDKGVQATLDQPVEVVKKAAVDALTVIGCTIKKDEATYVEGAREHKMGVMVGSGGETVSVTLALAGDGNTSVDIRTRKSFLGMAGQKNWDQPVLDEINKVLLAAPAAPVAPVAPAAATP